MKHLISAVSLVTIAFSAVAADGPAKPTGGKEGVMMERSLGEEKPSVAGKTGKAGVKMERSAGEEMKGMAPANQALKGAMSPAKGAATGGGAATRSMESGPATGEGMRGSVPLR